MNLPNKLTMSRIILTIVIIILCLFPFYSVGINFPKFNVSGIVVDSTYFLAGIIYIIAAITDFLDGNIARKNNLVTDTGKMLDAIADKVLVNSILVIFAAKGFVPAIVPVIYIFRDEIVNTFKMDLGNKGKVVAAIKTGKIKTASMMVGIGLMFFYNLPFELINIKMADFLIYFAVIMSIISGIEYYNMWKKNK
ncbi:MAG: CDP-diacylglycerol--glycerol-3-phosphate 3-phosphatidyltransferase [Erysipelotrichaceae bacterium]|nr:CDP-diacylglycerol--glycerol-3-phosphate 3-phosphatidyltransferase [Erysipelotrichaceae bacterium]